jgi:hypothetical protein
MTIEKTIKRERTKRLLLVGMVILSIYMITAWLYTKENTIIYLLSALVVVLSFLTLSVLFLSNIYLFIKYGNYRKNSNNKIDNIFIYFNDTIKDELFFATLLFELYLAISSYVIYLHAIGDM